MAARSLEEPFREDEGFFLNCFENEPSLIRYIKGGGGEDSQMDYNIGAISRISYVSVCEGQSEQLYKIFRGDKLTNILWYVSMIYNIYLKIFFEVSCVIIHRTFFFMCIYTVYAINYFDDVSLS